MYITMLIIFGILSGSLLSILVGILGSRRKIGFGWTLLISLIFTPLLGLVAVLLSDELPEGERRWGCIAPFLVFLVIVLLIATLSMLFWGSMMVI